jgi:hypothetical protein
VALSAWVSQRPSPANVLHAEGNPISQVISAWPPLALLITVELVPRVPIAARWWSFVRITATTVIAGIAAWVSYWHMVGVALRYGESTDAAHLLPLSVDGLIAVASVCLIELSNRRPTGTDTTPTAEIATVAGPPYIGEPFDLGPPPTPVEDLEPEPWPRSYKPRVEEAHRQHPTATNGQLAELAGVSLKTVERHRPARQLNGATYGQTQEN